MNTSVVTKARKKQPAKQEKVTDFPVAAPSSAAFERALMQLEGLCARFLDHTISESDSDRLCWLQRLNNIITPVSLALVEYKGPRRFHFHYRHRAEDESILHPVLEEPAAMLVQVCDYALGQCQKKLVGTHDRDLVERQRMLETALRNVVYQYK